MTDATHIDVSYVANLARIELTEEETELFQGQIDQVLEYVEQLSEIDVSTVEPTTHSVPQVNVLRADQPGAVFDPEMLLANAPARRDGQILVPKIVDG